MTPSSHPGQMIWKLPGASDTALHLRHHPSEPWRFYQEFPQYVRPDPPEFSQGYATFLALLNQGWEAVRS
ncbi:hypothetical protein GS597_06070 [Synechococcales cyanobacterium C]|uniref:Uncharacterized protein n=1 Tax=Petrachloros mirabilis ULC683 TaxID=2781853 RepID=A0A8K1ZXU4_9CYAN|nr:hypothetical protein [Petrachloros mirabilis]NCJ06088.1 hypothetical protein [Petrachloros mirabilis ULC683]